MKKNQLFLFLVILIIELMAMCLEKSGIDLSAIYSH